MRFIPEDCSLCFVICALKSRWAWDKNTITIIINIRVSSIAPEFPRTVRQDKQTVVTRNIAYLSFHGPYVKTNKLLWRRSTQASTLIRYLTGIQSSFSHKTHSEFELESSWIFKLLYTSLCINNIWLLQIFQYSTTPNIQLTASFCNVLFQKSICPTDFPRSCQNLVDNIDSHHRQLSFSWG